MTGKPIEIAPFEIGRMIADGRDRFCRSADLRPAAQHIVVDDKIDGKRHLKAVSTSTLRVSKVMSITSSSGDHFDDRDRQCWKPQGAAELRA